MHHQDILKHETGIKNKTKSRDLMVGWMSHHAVGAAASLLAESPGVFPTLLPHLQDRCQPRKEGR